MAKTKSILFSILWAVILLLFPISSGILATVLQLNQTMIFFVQGSFMLIAIIIPLVYIMLKKYSFKNFGFRKTEKQSAKKVLFYIPLVLIVLPPLVVGIDFQSVMYFFALLFFATCVAIAEEIYFRGIIYTQVKNAFSSYAAIIIITSLIFGIGHGASIIGTGDVVATVLQIINAFFFGIVAIETVMLTKSLYPAILLHFLYNFSNYVTTASGTTEIIYISIQVAITIIVAICYGITIKKDKHLKQLFELLHNLT